MGWINTITTEYDDEYEALTEDNCDLVEEIYLFGDAGDYARNNCTGWSYDDN